MSLPMSGWTVEVLTYTLSHAVEDGEWAEVTLLGPLPKRKRDSRAWRRLGPQPQNTWRMLVAAFSLAGAAIDERPR